MEDRAKRSLGGMLALWVFWIFCGWFFWSLLNDLWMASQPAGFMKGARGAAGRNGFNIVSSALVLGLVGMILGAIAWYTRPRDSDT